MRWQGIVEIFAGGDAGSRGSGYRIAPGLVLTARHVVAAGAPVELRAFQPDALGLPGAIGTWQAATVAWLGPEGDDLALLRPAHGAAFDTADGAEAAVLGRLDGRASVSVDAIGFPRALLDGGYSRTLHIEAQVNAWSGLRGEAMLLSVQGAGPDAPDGWKGMSGAAVFGGDRLVGVLQAVPGRLQQGALYATPAHQLLDHAPAQRLLDAAGVRLDPQFIDAAYVAQLPAAGHWGGLREAYARAVLEAYCNVGFLGLAVSGAPAARRPAQAVFSAWQMRLWPAEARVVVDSASR